MRTLGEKQRLMSLSTFCLVCVLVITALLWGTGSLPRCDDRAPARVSVGGVLMAGCEEQR